MQNAALRALRLSGAYLKFRVPATALGPALAAARALGFCGVNLTIPLKQAALRLMDRLSEQARRTGSVNTVTFLRSGRAEGHTTDGEGFIRSLRWDLGLAARGRRVVMLGAGGAARSVAFALADAGARSILMVDIEVSRARRLAANVRSATGVRTAALSGVRGVRWGAVLGEADLLVNATPVGMRPGEIPVPPAALHAGLAVADLVYNPPVTMLVQEARRRGLRAMNGEGMLVHQGALSLERWTGRRAPADVMRRALRAALRGQR
jgi:shikimate dehydrogenase